MQQLYILRLVLWLRVCHHRAEICFADSVLWSWRYSYSVNLSDVVPPAGEGTTCQVKANFWELGSLATVIMSSLSYWIHSFLLLGRGLRVSLLAWGYTRMPSTSGSLNLSLLFTITSPVWNVATAPISLWSLACFLLEECAWKTELLN